jgi:putative NADPH-quinone reductase
MSRRILIIDGHPDPARERLCHGLADAYAKGASGAGHAVRRIDLHALDFALLTSRTEFETGSVPPDVGGAQEALVWCDHMVLIYPLWLGTMPARLKGLLEQLLRPDFAFETSGWKSGTLRGRSVRVVVTMGMPGWIYRWYFGAHSLKSLEQNILKFVGMGPIRETLYGSAEDGAPNRQLQWIAEMERLGAEAR